MRFVLGIIEYSRNLNKLMYYLNVVKHKEESPIQVEVKLLSRIGIMNYAKFLWLYQKTSG